MGAVIFVSSRLEGDAGAGAAGAGGGLAAVGVHRRYRRRDRVPARLLAGRIAAHGVAGGLRRVADANTPTRLRRSAGRWYPLRTRVFRLSGNRAAACSRISIWSCKPGSVVAIVGENGAGKSTLVKLLCRMYQPDQGRILVDGVDLARIRADEWRSRSPGAFQDFFRFEFRARHSVGIGDVPGWTTDPRWSRRSSGRERAMWWNTWRGPGDAAWRQPGPRASK